MAAGFGAEGRAYGPFIEAAWSMMRILRNRLTMPESFFACRLALLVLAQRRPGRCMRKFDRVMGSP
jgi:hypothetical protein